MTHTITQFEGVVTVRIDRRANAVDLAQNLKAVLDAGTNGPVVIVIDLSLTRELGQSLKANLYRILQHTQVAKIGFSGVSADVGAELKDMIPLLIRVRPVVIGITETDVRQKLGLAGTVPGRKLTGMLSYLEQPQQTAK